MCELPLPMAAATEGEERSKQHCRTRAKMRLDVKCRRAESSHVEKVLHDSREKRFTDSNEARYVEVYGNIEHWIKAGWKMEVGKKWREGRVKKRVRGGGRYMVRKSSRWS